MLSVFPYLLSFMRLEPLMIRVTLGAVLIFWAFRAIRKASKVEQKLLGLVEGVIGILLVIGLWTQVAALAAAIELLILIGERISKRAFFTDGVNYYFILFVLAVSLLVTGAGFFAFDLPL